MPPNNLRAVVAQMYLGGSRQSARNLCSSPPSSSSSKGEGVIATGLKSRDSSLVPINKSSFLLCTLVGFTGCYVWDTVNVWKLHQRFGERKEEFERLKTSKVQSAQSVVDTRKLKIYDRREKPRGMRSW